MTDWYRVHVTVDGVGSWNVRQGDPAAYGPMAPLRLMWAADPADPWPFQIPPIEGELNLILPEAHSGVKVGAAVGVRFWLDYLGAGSSPTYLATLVFTITDVKAVPRALGMQYTCALGDALFQLAEQPITDTHLASDILTASDYIDWIGQAAGLEDPPTAAGLTQSLHGLGVKDLSVLEAYQNVLRSMTVLTSVGFSSFVIAPETSANISHAVTAQSADGTPLAWDFAPVYLIDLATRTDQPSTSQPTPPAHLANTGIDGWGLAFDAAPGAASNVVPASLVKLDDVSWQQTKDARVDTVVIPYQNDAGASGSATYTRNPNPSTRVTRQLPETHARSGADINAAGQFNAIDADQPSDRFRADSFKLRASGAAPYALAFGIFNLLGIVSSSRPYVVITDIDPRWNANAGVDFYAGVLRGVELSIGEGGTYSLAITVDQYVPRQAPIGVGTEVVLTYAAMRADAAQKLVTFDQLSPRFAIYDYRLVRRNGT